MSDLQRTRVHCFLLEENFAFHLLFGCSGRLERNIGTNESLLVTREATPSGGNPKSLHRGPPSQKHCHAARGRCGLSVRANSSSLGGAGEDSSRPIQSLATGQCSRIAESMPRCPSLRRRTAARRRTTIVTKEEEGRIRGAAFRTTAGCRPITMPHGKCRGHRWGRPPHGTLCSLTRVSI
jgi:hypothetical protein